MALQVFMRKGDIVEIEFEGHTFQISYNEDTMENLKMVRVI